MNPDLPAYTRRIEYSGALGPTLETLRNLHLAHSTHIPFENLDVLLGRPIQLDLDSLFAKLVHAERGGYCFEQNALFASVLEEIGFRVTRLAARVRLGASGIRPRSHMLLAVEREGETWIADVGFGAEVFLHPIPLRPGEVSTQFGWQYRIVPEESAYVLQSLRPEGWFDLYSFTLERQYPVDYEVSNHFTSTFAQSPFRSMLMVQRPGTESRLSLMNRRLIEQEPGSAPKEVLLPGDDELLEVLAGRFGLRLAAGTRFPIALASSAP